MEPVVFEPVQFELNKAVEIGGLWLGPMLGPVAAALWTVVGPPLLAMYSALLLSSGSVQVGQALGQALGTVLLVAMIVLVVVVILVSIVAILILILGISFLVTVLRLTRRDPTPA